MPGHSATAATAKTSMPGGANANTSAAHPSSKSGDDPSLTSKFKNLFKKGSPKSGAHQLPDETETDAPSGAARNDQGVHPASLDQTGISSSTSEPGGGDAASNVYSTTETAVDDKILDQTARGQMMPTAEANRVGATNLNSNAETDWPGMIKGEKLGAVTVDLRSIDKSKVVLGGGKKGEGSWVIVPVSVEHLCMNARTDYARSTLTSLLLCIRCSSQLERAITTLPNRGRSGLTLTKIGLVQKGELSASGASTKLTTSSTPREAELLHHYITTNLENIGTAHQRVPPESTQLRLRPTGGTAPVAADTGSNAESNATAQAPAADNVTLAQEVQPN